MAGPETPIAAPRFCSDHPDRELRASGGWQIPDPVRGKIMQCDAAGHGYLSRHRCAWCGGPMLARHEGGRLARPYRAAYCSPAHRLAAWRAETLAARDPGVSS
jgi:hypothetical protein